MRITVGSQDEAERTIAAIWIVLERANIPSPQVRIPRSVPPRVAIELIFEDRIHEDFVSREVPGVDPSNSAASPAHLDIGKPDREKRLRDKAEELRTAAEVMTATARASFIQMAENSDRWAYLNAPAVNK